MAHLLIAATQKSSGKTTFTTGLAAALARRGMAVQPFKKGPDYIDPMWLGRAAGRPCINLDFHCMTKAEIIAAFRRRDATADISIVETNKGLFDGVDVEGRDSNAALASLLGAPIILVIDTLGMTRGIAPLVLGYENFDPDIHIAGVVLNKVGGPRHEDKLRAALKYYTDLPVLGALGRDPALEIPERHLGLVPANEAGEADRSVDSLCKAVSANIDLDRIVEIARTADGPCAVIAPAPVSVPTSVPRTKDIRIGVARDAAFGFYYPDDLEALESAGAEIVPFDCLEDAALPDVDGLFIGGGFPETQMAALEANQTMLVSIRSAIEGGLPTYAECGGLMYLSRSLTWRGETREMVGVIPGDAIMHPRPQGRGYVVLEETGGSPWSLSTSTIGVPAHEFHYASLENLPRNVTYAWRVLRGHGIDGQHDGIVQGNLLAGFSHLRDVEGVRWAAPFVRFVRDRRMGMGRTAIKRPASAR